MAKVIEVKNLTKKYGKLTAVDDISFVVQKGEIFGILGENGAGKTTTMEIIESLRQATSGEVKILGHNVKQNLREIKEKIGVQLQFSAYYQFLNLEEILNLFSSFYSQNLSPKELLRMVNLEEKNKTFVGNLSGGQKQRFSIVASLINDPEIVFLDEPTTGLDPIARRHLWEIITQIKKQGKTVILTTHYMEEAETLCDRIAIMEKGKILAMGETHELVEKAKNPYKINFIAKTIDKKTELALSKIGEMKMVAGKKGNFEIQLKTQNDVNKALSALSKIKPESLTVGRATLEDLFVELTGHGVEDEENGNA